MNGWTVLSVDTAMAKRFLLSGYGGRFLVIWMICILSMRSRTGGEGRTLLILCGNGEIKVAIEVKGYGPHVQQIDRTRYRQELNRETYLQIAGYQVVAVPYDDLESASDLTISLFKSLLAPSLLINTDELEHHYTRLERDIMRAVVRWNGMIRPVDLANGLRVHPRTIRKSLTRLCEKGKLRPVPASGSSRICRYEYVPSIMNNGLW